MGFTLNSYFSFNARTEAITTLCYFFSNICVCKCIHTCILYALDTCVSTHFITPPLSLHPLSQWISKCHQHYTETLRQTLQPSPTLRPEFRGYFWTTGLNNGNLMKAKGSTEIPWLNIDRSIRQPNTKYLEALNDQWTIYNQAQISKEKNFILLRTFPPSPFENSPHSLYP